MNTIEFTAFLINILVACSALPMEEQQIGGQPYQVQRWRCQVEAGPIVIKGYRRQCDTGHTKYWGRMFFLQFEEWQTAMYMNQFGEVYSGQGAQLSDAYQPACGS